MQIAINGEPLDFWQCTKCSGKKCVVATDSNYCNILQCAMNDGIKPEWEELNPYAFEAEELRKI